MNDVIREWRQKAEADLLTARRESTAESSPNFDAACFHAQQAAEKLMKALLIAGGQAPLRTHDLVVLGDSVASCFAGWSFPLEELRFLSRAAVVFRYPGESAERRDAEEAVVIADRLCASLSKLLTDICGA